MHKQIVLVTGGTGYIGSHTVMQLLAAGAKVVVLDNLSNSHPEVLRRIEATAGRLPLFIEGDIRDRACVKALFKAHAIDAVIHFSGHQSFRPKQAHGRGDPSRFRVFF